MFFMQGIGSAMTTEEKIGREVRYVVSCQFREAGNLADGAINTVFGIPTWVEPGINASGILTFIEAYKFFEDVSFIEKANLVAEYLIRIQNVDDGSWCNQYGYATPGDINNPNREALARSPRHTAQVIYALYELYKLQELDFMTEAMWYKAIEKGANYLMGCQAPENKGGRDDGLICGGKDADGNFRRSRWVHDNSYAYWALEATELWAEHRGEENFSTLCAKGAKNILEGINESFYDSNTGVWHIALDENGIPLKNPHLPCLGSDAKSYPSWLQIVPQMLDLPANGVGSSRVAEWILRNLMQADGGCFEWCCEDGEFKKRLYPGSAFQIALVLFDIPGYNSYAKNVIAWAEESGLWRENSRIKWVDWYESEPDPNRVAPSWMACGDTSLLSILCWLGGHNFAISPTLAELAEKEKKGGCFIRSL